MAIEEKKDKFEEYNEAWLYPTTGILNLTDDCNLACHYCFVQQQPNYMSYQTAKTAVDWLNNNYWIKKEKNLLKDDNWIGIQYFGGEPTLLWDKIIVPLTLYIREKYGWQFQIGMTTNGTLLDEEKISFLRKYDVGILLSIDGDKDTQDLTRPCRNGKSSFDLIVKNIPKILELFPQTTFRATINQENVNKLFHNFLFAESLGFKQCFFSPNEREKWTEENLLILEQEVTKIFQYQALLFKNNIIPSLTSTLIRNSLYNAIDIYQHIMKNETIQKDKIINPRKEYLCGIGQSSVSINFEGEIYTCQEQDSRNKTNKIFNIGNIYNGIDKEKHLKLLNYVEKDQQQFFIECENQKICNTCKIYSKCKSLICPSTSHDLYQNIYKRSEVFCRYYNSYANNALVLFQLLNDNECFINYIENLGQKEMTYYGPK